MLRSQKQSCGVFFIMNITLPEGKISDYIDGKLRNDTPEEYVRQTIERRLIDELRYNAAQVQVEYPLRLGTAKPRADIVIWDSNVKEHTQETIHIIIECKKDSVLPESSKDGIEQLRSYMHICPNCEWGMWTNRVYRVVVRKIKTPSGESELTEYNDIPSANGSVEDIDRPKLSTLRNASSDNLLFVFRTCHNYIYANDGLQKQPAFFEFLKLIFCKIYDEHNNLKSLKFYATSQERSNPDGQLAVKNRISQIFSEVKSHYGRIFDGKDTIALNPRSLAYIVSELQGYSLLSTNIDIKGKAYEEIVGANLRGDRGEFFTPRNIMRMTVEMINPGLNERVLDSSCGTGGFLVTAMTHTMDSLRREYEEAIGLPYERWDSHLKEDYSNRKDEIMSGQYFGFDLNPDLVKATKMNMVMNNDGSGNILQVNSLLPPHMWPDDFRSHLANALKIQPASIRNHRSIALFDVIVTNPPFGSKIPVRDSYILEQFELAYSWKRDKDSGRWVMTDNLQSSVPPEILFVERCTQFLKEGGRMGIILPDSILGSPSLGYIRQWILVNHTVIASIDLTSDTFQPHNGTQTSILILQKKTQRQKDSEAANNHLATYKIFMACVDRVGHDRRGNPLYRRDNEGNEILVRDGEGKPERITDDQTEYIAGIFREWQKKTTFAGSEDIKCCAVGLDEVLAGENLRLEANIFNDEARTAARDIEGGKYPAVKFGELVSVYLCGREGRVIHMKTQHPFYSSSEMLDIKPNTDSYLYSRKASDVEEFIVHEGQILISRSGTIGRVAYVSKTLDGRCINSHALRISCHNPKVAGYIYVYLKTRPCQKLLQSLAFGAVIQHITPEHLSDIPVPDAPAEIRRRIHDLIAQSYALRDESNTMLDDAESLMVNALNLPPVDDMRPGGEVLAFEASSADFISSGRFEASYHSPLFGEIVRHLQDNAGEVLSVGNERVSRDIILPGRFKRVYVSEGYGAVFIGGKQLGELDPADKKYLSFSQHEDRIRDELTIHTNMILITCSGTIGNVALVPEHWDGWTASQHIIRVVPASENIAGYAYVFLASEWGRELLRRYKYGAVIDEINAEHVGDVPFPILRDKGIQERVNSLALEANSRRYEAWRLEREAMRIMESEVLG